MQILTLYPKVPDHLTQHSIINICHEKANTTIHQKYFINNQETITTTQHYHSTKAFQVILRKLKNPIAQEEKNRSYLQLIV